MELLVLWLGTCITSIFMEVTNELRIFKDAADAGYKINVKKVSELGKQLTPNAAKVTLFSLLIPIFNIMQAFQRTIQYNNVRPMILDQLSAMDALEEMSELEKEEYSKNPSLLNAFLSPLKADMRLSESVTIEINDDNEQSKISYEMGDSLDDITILKVIGPISKLSEEEQKEKIIETLKTILEEGVNKYGDTNTFINVLKNNTSVDLTNVKEFKKDKETILPNTSKTSISEQKQALENLKNELLEEKEIQSNNENEGPTLSRRKK